MQIEKINRREFELWRSQVEELFNESVKLNFPNSSISNDYGKCKCEDVFSYLEDGSAIVFIAHDNDVLLGWAWCHEIKKLEKKRIHVAEIAVSTKYQNNGIGKLLMGNIEEYAYKNGYKEMELFVTANNKSAVSFYNGLLFEVERYQMCKKVSSDYKRIK